MLSRDEKIDRIFIILNLLVKLMEIDLSIWIVRYPFQTRKHMCNITTCPLIAHLLWKGKDCGEMNVIIRNILELFMTCLWIDFPDDKIDILAVSELYCNDKSSSVSWKREFVCRFYRHLYQSYFHCHVFTFFP